MQRQIPKRMAEFFKSEQGVAAKQILLSMESDDKYNTRAVYSPNTELYPDNQKTFVQTHMDFLGSHPDVVMDQYLSNLRLITRIK